MWCARLQTATIFWDIASNFYNYLHVCDLQICRLFFCFLFFCHVEKIREGVRQWGPMAGITRVALGTAASKMWAHVGKNSWERQWSAWRPRNPGIVGYKIFGRCLSDLSPSVCAGFPSKKWGNARGRAAPWPREWEAVKWHWRALRLHVLSVLS